jgi:hypothetical protein
VEEAAVASQVVEAALEKQLPQQKLKPLIHTGLGVMMKIVVMSDLDLLLQMWLMHYQLKDGNQDQVQ